VSNSHLEQAIKDVADTQEKLDSFSKCGGIDELDNARWSLDSARERLAKAIEYPEYQFTYLHDMETWLYEANCFLNKLLA
jgi:hypothetical protein